MILADALEELRESILRDASTLKSGPPDHYWGDSALVRYLNDACRRFTRKTLCIRDDTTPLVCQVELSADENMYALHPSVIHVLSARHQDDQQDLVRIQHARAANTVNENTEDWGYQLSIAPGKPTRYSTDEGVDVDSDYGIRMRFVGTPDTGQAGKIVYLRVARTPLAALSMEDMQAKIEIPSDWELDWIEWAAYRALRNWDLDAEDRQKAEQHKTRFEEAVRECKAEMIRKLWQPVKWGFGGGGFTYIR